jgi:hypothetical protein
VVLDSDYREYTIILKLELSFDNELKVTNLKLVLTKDITESTDMITVNFECVSNFSVKELGGGISQLLYLRIKDIKDKQWDRANYEVSEFERDSIYFLCQNVKITHKSMLQE